MKSKASSDSISTDQPANLSAVARSLVSDGYRLRPVTLDSEQGRILWQLIEKVFVDDRGYLEVLECETWDAVSRYYLLTRQGLAVGGLRIADPGSFEQDPVEFRRHGSRLPMEDWFPLDTHVADVREFFEPGRAVVLPEFRRQGGFILLMGAAYLYAVHKQKRGALCLASPETVNAYHKTGWRPLAEPFFCSHYRAPAHPLIVETKGVPERYRLLFREAEDSGLIQI